MVSLHRRSSLATAGLSATVSVRAFGLFLALFLLAALDVAVTSAATDRDRPNLVLVLADDLGYGDLVCFGHPLVKTPHLDRLAQRGVRLTNFYADAPVCSPTRAALLTGRVPQRNGLTNVIEVEDEHSHLSAAEQLLPQLLKAHGYVTGIVGKWHLGEEQPYRPNQRGFDYFFGGLKGGLDFFSHDFIGGRHDLWQDNTAIDRQGSYITDLSAAEAERFIDAHDEVPFFLYVPFHAVHTSMGSKTRNAVQVTPAGLERYVHDASAGGDIPIHLRMAAFVSAMDDAVGRILQALARHDLSDRTLVIFTSDNGPVTKAGGSAGPFRGEKHSLWEGGIRVPTIACWPGKLPAGTTSNALSATHDVLPTLMAAAQLPLPAGLKVDGQNLLPALSRNITTDRSEEREVRTLCWSYVRDSLGTRERAVRRGPWKWLNDELYNLDDDAGETTDLAATHPDTAAALAQAWEKWVGQFPRELERWGGRDPQRKPTKRMTTSAS
jgi:arylsulfatase A